jgi:hypothetical protein
MPDLLSNSLRLLRYRLSLLTVLVALLGLGCSVTVDDDDTSQGDDDDTSAPATIFSVFNDTPNQWEAVAYLDMNDANNPQTPLPLVCSNLVAAARCETPVSAGTYMAYGFVSAGQMADPNNCYTFSAPVTIQEGQQVEARLTAESYDCVGGVGDDDDDDDDDDDFICDDGEAIPAEWECDGETDCANGEDEANCP